jgi:hypothetical protein
LPCSLRTRLREEVAPIPAINGRPAISRAGMAARGVPSATASTWYRDRTGHPEKAGRVGRTDYWYEDEWVAWYEAHQRGKTESLTQVDRQGDPNDLVDAAEAARILRYAGRDVIHANRRLGYFPQPETAAPAWAAAASQAHPPSRTRMPATRGSTESWPSSAQAPGPPPPAWPRSGTSAGGQLSASSARQGPSNSSKPTQRNVFGCRVPCSCH